MSAGRTLAQVLWPRRGAAAAPHVYAVLDGARNDAIAPAVRESGSTHECLYAGALSPALELAAPHMVRVEPESHFFHKIVHEGWGRAWGIFVVVAPGITSNLLRKHLRTLLRVQDEHSRVLMFRFYDPRVLRVYLPTCTVPERAAFFGPIDTLVCEDDADGAPMGQERGAVPAVLRFEAVADAGTHGNV
jgi:hypothetical protein